MISAMILAAGRGSRLRPVSDTTPKSLVTIKGVPLIVYHLRKLANLNINNIVINTSWLASKVEGYLGFGESFNVDITYSREADLLETAGGIVQALPLIKSDPFLVINADVFTFFDFSDLLHLPDDLYAKLVLFDNPSHNLAGDFSIAQDKLINLGSAGYTFGGIGIYRKQMFRDYPAGIALPLSEVFRKFLPDNKIGAMKSDAFWFDVGTLDRVNKLEQMLS